MLTAEFYNALPVKITSSSLAALMYDVTDP
jgi:hypothetical protein